VSPESSRAPLPRRTDRSLTAELTGIALQPVGRGWDKVAWIVALCLTAWFAVSVVMLLWHGVGIWGLDHPNIWGFDIVGYVWWMGLGNAGAIISGLLLLIGHGWRNVLNRMAETMTLFSAAIAGLFPILHLGRPWLFWWTIPHENTQEIWPNFRSPLTWDAFAVITYLGVVLTFWYIGMLPDLATMRDRARRRGWAMFYGVLALGWRGSAIHWRRWEIAYRTIAAVSLPYVILIHSGVGLLYAGGPIPGWGSTTLPPLLMVGGTLAGFAVIALLAIVLRTVYGLDRLLTINHLDMLARVTLATSLVYLYIHVAEIWTILYRADPLEMTVLEARVSGVFAPFAWFGWIGSLVVPQLYWLTAVRRSPAAQALISVTIAVAIFSAHYMLQESPLSRGPFPAMWEMYVPTVWDTGLFIGTIGLFLLLALVFLRSVPVVSVFEAKEVLDSQRRPDA